MSHFDAPVGMFVTRYHNRRFGPTLKFMNRTPGVIYDKGLLRKFRAAGFDIDLKRDNKSVYEPQVLFDRLRAYDVLEKPRPDSRVLDGVIKRAYATFGGRRDLRMDKGVNSVWNALLHERSSGAPLFKKKGEAFDQDWERAHRIIEGEVLAPPCVAYHRVQHGSEGPKTRLVWGYPQSMTILESMAARPLIDRFLKIRTPIAFGLRKLDLASRLATIGNRYYKYGLDFSKFDSTVPKWLVLEAFNILRTHFDFDDEDDAIWRKIKNYFVFTPIIMPDGNVYMKKCGIPSGSYFTQLVGSIVNYIVINFIYEVETETKLHDDCMLFLGDDSLFGSRFQIDLDAISRHAKQWFGMNIGAAKSHVAVGHDCPIEFLGHHWDHGIIDRDLDDSIKRLIFQERPMTIDNYREYMRVKLLSLVADSKSAWAMLGLVKSINRNNFNYYFEKQRILEDRIWSGFAEGQPRMRITGVQSTTDAMAAAYLHILL